MSISALMLIMVGSVLVLLAMSIVGAGALPSLTSLPEWLSPVVGAVSAAAIIGTAVPMSMRAGRTSQELQLKERELQNSRRELLSVQDVLEETQSLARIGSFSLDFGSGQIAISAELAGMLGVEAGRSMDTDSFVLLWQKSEREVFTSTLENLRDTNEPAVVEGRPIAVPERTMQLLARPVTDDAGRRSAIGTVQDVTEARDARARIEQLSHYDELTGLPNRVFWRMYVQTAIHSALRHGDRLAVLVLDVDDFKTVNDSLGHQFGDRILRAIAARIHGGVRREDLVARFGADEFVVFISRIRSRENVHSIAEKLRDAVSRPLPVHNYEINLTVGTGVALYPDDGEDMDRLIQHADTAMHQAKSAGRNSIRHFEHTMDLEAKERLLLETGIRRAMERDEFCLLYQPQVAGRPAVVTGAEALIRWVHPEEGMLSPAMFIPAAEQSGLIISLGDWVLREACLQQVAWTKAGYADLEVAVNVSALQCHRHRFSDQIRAIVKDTGVNAAKLKLEITESTLMDISEELITQLNELKDMGITFSLDDFGTGYSSLSYLKKLPISQIKLDRSFVSDLPDDPENAAIAETAISMANSLGIEVIAEGVETVAQRDFLLEHNCSRMQGFLFARPRAAAEVFEIGA